MRDGHSGGLALCEHREGYLARSVVPGVLPGVKCLVRDHQNILYASRIFQRISKNVH